MLTAMRTETITVRDLDFIIRKIRGRKMQNYLEKIDRVIAQGRYKDTWESLQQYRVPDWYVDAKFGIFIHWGLYSIPAFGSEWYSRNMYVQGSKEFEHHVKTYGKHTEFGYKDFIPMFRAEKFVPSEWAELFKEAGAQYIMPVAEHHDGFQMYGSELSEWNAVQMGPKRDLLGELYEALDKEGLVSCASSHRIEHWFFMGHGKEFESDIKEPMKRGDFYWPAMPEREHMDSFTEPTPTQEFLEDWLCRCCELVDKYHPKVVYFDWWIHHHSVKPYLRKFIAYYYNRAEEWGEGVVVNYKHDSLAFATGVADVERGQFADAKPYIWQTDTSVAKNSWGYTEGNDYKTPVQIVHDLVDIVSKNGRLLLNIGPKADGSIPVKDREILLSIGKWLKVNGEAIYGSKMWRQSAEGPTKIVEGQFADSEAKKFTSEDIRFTVNNGCIYAICMNMKGKDSVSIKALSETENMHKPDFSGIIQSVEVLGYTGKLEWTRDKEALKITMDTVESEYPVVFKVKVD